jgi:hypothetical protein
MLLCVSINKPEVMNLTYIPSDGYRNSDFIKNRLPIYVTFSIVAVTILSCF